MTNDPRSEAAETGRSLSAAQRDRFSQRVLPYLDAAYNLARHILRDDQDAQDAVQDAFVRALRYFDGFRGVDGRAWLLRIVRNTCLTRIRARREEAGRVEFDEEVHTAAEPNHGLDEELVRRQEAGSVREGLDLLAPEFREALVLRELEGMSYKEIAEVTGVPIGTVMSRLARARRQLVAALGAGETG
ncbi:MAG: sigma-70 family RNA polymerase sigma factor [Hyphomicrobiales bacterium]